MSFDLISDLHVTPLQLVSKATFPKLKPMSDTLVVLGDVCEQDQIKSSFFNVFQQLSKLWKHVLYVIGNHEYYFGYLDDTPDIIRGALRTLKNVVVLDNDVVQIDGVRFIGSTLWSDMDRVNPMSMLASQKLVSDYRFIRKDRESNRPIIPQDTVVLFHRNLRFLNDMVSLSEESVPNVVLTHHAPSYQSVTPKFKDSPINGAFVSDLTEFILNNPSIKVWAHGHTHSPCDYLIGDCRVVNNPFGYPSELQKTNTYQAMTIDAPK